MKININLDNDFERQLEKLKLKYGEEITKINGFSEEQLDSDADYPQETGRTAKTSPNTPKETPILLYMRIRGPKRIHQ